MSQPLAVLLTTEEVAERFRVHPSTVRRWRLDDVGPRYIRIGNIYRYPEDSLEVWMRARTRQSLAS